MSDDVTPTSTPALRLIRGDATAEEIAAVIAVLSAAGGGDAPTAPAPRRSAWNDPARLLGTPGPRSGGWRRSTLPR